MLADTHAVVWYLLGTKRLSSNALETLEAASRQGDPIFIASITLVEMQYLVEKGRLPDVVLDRLNAALDAPDPALVVVSLDRGVAASLAEIPRNLVPEMADRIIAATAHHLHVPIITRDTRLQATDLTTIW